MDRKVVSGVMLTLLLMGMLTLASSIQPVRTDFDTSEAEKSFFVDDIRFAHNGTNHNKKGNKEQVRIVEHRITALELEKLKQEIGVWEEGENYNQIIGGHGTGLRPPTEREWAQIMGNAYVVEKILLDETIQSPSAVDHTTKPWFPPVGNQGSEGSCTAWAVGYYMKTFQEAKEHDWNLSGAVWDGGHPSVEYQDRIISPDFIYHLINNGVDNGSSSMTAINMICSIGTCSWEKMPYDPNDHTSWPSEEAWREAPLYRGNSSGWEYMWISTDDDVASLKGRIASNNLAKITVDGSKIYNGLWSLLTSKDMLTLDNYEPPWNHNALHAVAIVGYDDNFEYTEQGETRHGAFKIVNSWGIGGFLGWENVPDGCFWISYEAMKQRVRYCEFYRDRIGYEPELVASFRITHLKRGECNITVGVGSQTKWFNQYTLGGNQSFCSNNILFDITEFKDAMPNVYGQEFFLEVYDGGSFTTGTINKFAIEYAQSRDAPLYTVNNGYVYAYVTLLPFETNWISEKLVNLDKDFIDSKISMATDSNGYLYIAYEDWYPAINQCAIFVRCSTDGGNTWPIIMIGYDATHNLRYPSIAIDPYSNDIFVAVEREWTSNDHDVLVLRYVDGIWSWNAVANVLGSDDRFPSITSEYSYGGANWQYVSYEYVYSYNDRDLMFANSTDHGASWSVKKLHGNWPDYNVHAQTSITNAEGYIYIAYKWGADYDSPCEIRVDRSTDFGNSWTQYKDIDGCPNDCCFPSVAATHGGGTVLVAFQYTWSETDDDILYSYSTDKGENWNKGYFLFGSLENERKPTVAVDGEGTTENNVKGYFHAVCQVENYINYRKANSGTPSNWTYPEIVSERWIGEGLTVTTHFRNISGQFCPCVTWTDGRTKDIYYSTVLARNIVVTNVIPSKTVVGESYSLSINVTVENQGDITETFNLTAYANVTIIATLTNITLTNGNSIIITFTWNTIGFAKGNYTISANATTVPGETDTTDNTLTNGWVLITVPGDVDGNGECTILDIKRVKLALSGWIVEPNADIDNNGEINILDLKKVKLIYSGLL